MNAKKVSYSKDFDQINSDYSFFEKHATERKNGLDTLVKIFKGWESNKDTNTIQYFDFGAGDGEVSVSLVKTVKALENKNIIFSILEPSRIMRAKAIASLSDISTNKVQVWSEIPSNLSVKFDVILANHVFYYVEDFRESLNLLLAKKTEKGLMLITMANKDNGLVKIGNEQFKLMGLNKPTNSIEDVKTYLQNLSIDMDVKLVASRIFFKNSINNRAKILRFIFGIYYEKFPISVMNSLLDMYEVGDNISVPLYDEVLVIK